WFRATATEDAGEDVAEPATASFAPGCTRALREVIEVEAAEIERYFLSVGSGSTRARATSKPACALATAAPVGLGRRRIDIIGVEAELVVDLSLLGIAEDVVGFGERLELLLGSLVAWVYVGMILARQLAKRFADL